jgi:hypothetical protein
MKVGHSVDKKFLNSPAIFFDFLRLSYHNLYSFVMLYLPILLDLIILMASLGPYNVDY